jgi:hypothetical protein
MKTRTVGADSLAAQSDHTKYDPLEIGHALTDDILKEVWKCIDAHYNIIDEPEFCVAMVRASDPLIYGVMRRKFYAWPYLPKPRPEQIVFHYQKRTDTIIRLWSLPSAKVMAVISETNGVSFQWKNTKYWCDAFFSGFMYDNETGGFTNYNESSFYNAIRTATGINLESESEYLNAHRAEIVQASKDNLDTNVSDAFDFSKVAVEKVVYDSKLLPY